MKSLYLAFNLGRNHKWYNDGLPYFGKDSDLCYHKKNPYSGFLSLVYKIGNFWS